MTNPLYYYSGQHGMFFFDTNTSPAGSVKDWSFSGQMATLDATTLGDTYKVPVNGIRTLTGSCVLFWTTNKVKTTNHEPSSKMMRKMFKIRQSGDTNPGQADEAVGFRLFLKVDDGSGGTGQAKGRGLKMDVVATSISMRMTHGEILSANVSFESVGAPIEMSF